MSRELVIDMLFKQAGTDKNSESHNYAQIYAKIPWDISCMLEIGLGGGQSLKAWLDIFPKAEIWGIDCNEVDNKELMSNPRIHFVHTNINNLDASILPKFDLIVDDASHSTGDILSGYSKLAGNLRGTYVIEDIGESAIFPVLTGVPITASMIVTKHGGDNRVITWSVNGQG